VIGRNPQKEETVIWVVKKDPQISQKEEIVIWVVILTGLLPPKSGKSKNGEDFRGICTTQIGEKQKWGRFSGNLYHPNRGKAKMGEIFVEFVPPKSGKKRNGEEARFPLVTVSGNFHNKRSKDENDDEDSTCHGEAKNEPGWQETVGPVEP